MREPTLATRSSGRSRSSESPIFSNRFSVPGRALWLGRAKLFEDRIELKGWTLRGRFSRHIPLQRVARVEWWTGSPFCNLEFLLDDASTFGMKIEGAGRWKFAIDREAIGVLRQTPALPDTEKCSVAA